MQILTKIAFLIVILSLIALVAFAVYLFPILTVLLSLGFLFLEFIFKFRKGRRARAMFDLIKSLLLDWRNSPCWIDKHVRRRSKSWT